MADPWRWLPAVNKRRRHIPGRSERGGDWGLRVGPEPRDADRRIGEVLVAGVGLGFRENFKPIRPTTSRRSLGLGRRACTLAEAEGLAYHAEAIRRRLPEPEDS